MGAALAPDVRPSRHGHARRALAVVVGQERRGDVPERALGAAAELQVGLHARRQELGHVVRHRRRARPVRQVDVARFLVAAQEVAHGRGVRDVDHRTDLVPRLLAVSFGARQLEVFKRLRTALRRLASLGRAALILSSIFFRQNSK